MLWVLGRIKERHINLIHCYYYNYYSTPVCSIPALVVLFSVIPVLFGPTIVDYMDVSCVMYLSLPSL